jgi:hypothetical protein
MQKKRRGNKLLWVIVCLTFVLAIAASSTYATGFKKDCDSADMVLINGKILTVDKNFAVAQAVAVKDGRFLMVGSNHQVKHLIGRKTKVIDLQGKTVLPGINDSHSHPGGLAVVTSPPTLDLYTNVDDISDIQAMLDAVVANPGEWIRGSGWDASVINVPDCSDRDYRCLNKEQLDPYSHSAPVVFYDWTGHNLWVNSKALEIAGITKDTPDPEGGYIAKDPVTGEPTGILGEITAMSLVTKFMPLPAKEVLRESVLWGMGYMNSFGITSYTEGCLGPGHNTYGTGGLGDIVNEVYKDLHNEGKLTARVSVMISFMGVDYPTTLENLKIGLEAYAWPKGYDPKWLRFPGIKIFADGVPPSKTSFMWEEYTAQSGGGYGTLAIPGATDEEKEQELIKMIEYGHKKGFQVGIHATGDRAITACVDGFESAMKKYPKNRDPRHYVIHSDFVRPDDASRLARMRLGTNMNPDIKALISDIEPWFLGEERSAYEWPYRTAFDAGIRVTFSSDNITTPSWLHGIQSAVTRESFSGVVSGPEQAATREEAIRAYTINGAWQDKMEKVKGSIEKGKLADFVILDGDPLTVDVHKIADIKVLKTVVGGKVVYDSSAE